MKKEKRIVKIDLNEWTTMAKKAAALGLSESSIRQRVRRKKLGKLKPNSIVEETLVIEELDLVLVKKP